MVQVQACSNVANAKDFDFTSETTAFQSSEFGLGLSDGFFFGKTAGLSSSEVGSSLGGDGVGFFAGVAGFFSTIGDALGSVAGGFADVAVKIVNNFKSGSTLTDSVWLR